MEIGRGSFTLRQPLKVIFRKEGALSKATALALGEDFIGLGNNDDEAMKALLLYVFQRYGQLTFGESDANQEHPLFEYVCRWHMTSQQMEDYE